MSPSVYRDCELRCLTNCLGEDLQEVVTTHEPKIDRCCDLQTSGPTQIICKQYLVSQATFGDSLETTHNRCRLSEQRRQQNER